MPQFFLVSGFHQFLMRLETNTPNTACVCVRESKMEIGGPLGAGKKMLRLFNLLKRKR